MAWTDEKKDLVVEAYTERNPTPENSMSIVREIAEEIGESPNGVRNILTKRGVYIKVESAAQPAKAGSEGSKRVSKADAISALTDAIEKTGKPVDDEIISKLTGKAALYFASIISGE